MTSLPRRSNVEEEKEDEEHKASIDSTFQDQRNNTLDPENQDGRLPDYDDTQRRRSRASVQGDPFGDETDAEVKYRTMTWWQVSAVMIAETISLGILSLPSVLSTVGMVPGVILIAGLGILATYTGYVLGQFKMAYPHVHNMADAGEVLLGRFGREFFGAAQTIFLIFSMASHVLTFTIAFNAITGVRQLLLNIKRRNLLTQVLACYVYDCMGDHRSRNLLDMRLTKDNEGNVLVLNGILHLHSRCLLN